MQTQNVTLTPQVTLNIVNNVIINPPSTHGFNASFTNTP